MDPNERQAIIEKISKQIRKNNWDYLRRHPEIRAFIRVFLSEAVKDKPDKIYDFAANLFRCDNVADISEKVNEQIKRLKNLADGSCTEYAGDMFFDEVSNPQASERPSASSIENILKFSGILQDNAVRLTMEKDNETDVYFNVPTNPVMK